MSGDDEIDDWDIVGMDDFDSYGPILGCMAVPLCGIAVLLSWAIHSAGAPAWAQAALGLVYVTFPFAAFARWTWHKKAIRLRDGRVLRTGAARRFALTIWLTAMIILAIRFALS